MLGGEGCDGSGELSFELEVFAAFFAVDEVVHSQGAFCDEADIAACLSFGEVYFVFGEVSGSEFGGEFIPFGIGWLDEFGDLCSEGGEVHGGSFFFH